jgi:hypothetical protein
LSNEFGIASNNNFRQKLDYSNGMGSVRYYTIHHTYSHHHMGGKSEKVLEMGKNYDPKQKWTVYIPSSGKFGAGGSHTYKIEYIEQYFKKQSDTADASSEGTGMSAIGSFVLDHGKGFTQAGVSRINDSIRTFVWAILGAQSQTRSSILGTGRAFDSQKQFLANVEDSINSEINLPSSIERYQSTLQYARSKVDFVVAIGMYMIPSDMSLYIGKINGYNNLIVIASDDLQLGHNDEVNDEPPIVNDTLFDLPQDDFVEPTTVEPTTVEPTTVEPTTVEPTTVEPIDEFATPQSKLNKQINTPDEQIPQPKIQEQNELTHDERKLGLILGGTILGSALIWTLK